MTQTLFSKSNFLIGLAGIPTHIVFFGIFFETTLPAPIILPLPILTPGKILTPSPIHTLLPIVIGSVDISLLRGSVWGLDMRELSIFL